MANGNGNGNGERDCSFATPSIPKLDGHYEYWCLLMENFLRSKEYWSLIEKGIFQPEAGTVITEALQKRIDESKLKDLKAKNYLFQAIDRTVVESILDKSTSKAIWESLRKRYQGNSRVRNSILQATRKEFEGLEMKSGETVSEYIPRVMTIANKMRINGEDVKDRIIVEKILRSLTEKYDYVTTAIEEARDIDKISIEELHASLLVHEQRMRKNRGNGEEQALKAASQESGGRGRGNYRGRGRGRGRIPREAVECYKCHKIGHYRSDCPEWNKDGGANFTESSNNDDEELMLLMTEIDTIEDKGEDHWYASAEEMLVLMAETDDKKEQVWYLDSGCSNHMCGNKANFISLDEKFTQSVKLGNDTKLQVAGKGSVKVKLNGVVHIISNVYFIPDLKNNLISIGQLQEKGLTVLFEGGAGCCKIFHHEKGLVLESKAATNRMFKLFAQNISTKAQAESSCFHTSSEELTHLWHCRYGHLSSKLRFECSAEDRNGHWSTSACH